jgi:hypothetical protein
VEEASVKFHFAKIAHSALSDPQQRANYERILELRSDFLCFDQSSHIVVHRLGHLFAPCRCYANQSVDIRKPLEPFLVFSLSKTNEKGRTQVRLIKVPLCLFFCLSLIVWCYLIKSYILSSL